MNAMGFIGRTAGWTRMAFAALALVIMAPAAFAQSGGGTTVLPSMPTGCWKMVIVPDAAAKAAGRDAFEEYIFFEGMTFSGQEMARLGFDPGPITGGVNALGQTTYTVTIKSNSHGTAVSSGIYLGTSMTGTLTWTKPDGKVYVYNYTAAPYTPDPSIES